MTAINKDFRVKNGIVAGGNVTAISFIGDGSQLTGINTSSGIPDHSITFQKLAPSNFTYSTYTGDGSTLNYTLAQSTQTPEQLFVFVANVPQTPGTSYTVSGTTLSFSSAPPAGSNIVVRYYGTPLPYQTNVDWNATSGSAEILNKPTLFSGSYSDLTNKPTLFSGAYADLSGKPNLFSGYYADLSGKPTLFSGSYTDLTNKPTLSTVSATGSYNDLLDKPSIPSLTGYATETYVNTQVANIVNSAPAALDTLNELATALGNDSNFATTISTQLGLKANTASLGSAAFTSSSTYATAAQGGKADTAIQSITSSDASINVINTGTSVDLTVSADSPASTLVAQVRNETGATLTKGTIVYSSGAAGNKMLVVKALASGESTSSQTFGMITADIPNNQNGYATISGVVSGLNTSGLIEGGIIYLSPTVAGQYTQTKPQAPNHLVYVGIVTRVHANQGSIQTRIQNGYELDELHDVLISSKANNDLLRYDIATGVWKNAQLSSAQVTTALGYTPYNATNPNGYITGINSSNVTTALGYTPYNATNPNGYISSITSSNVTTALGYTPATAAQVQAANDNAVAMAIALG